MNEHLLGNKKVTYCTAELLTKMYRQKCVSRYLLIYYNETD